MIDRYVPLLFSIVVFSFSVMVVVHLHLAKSPRQRYRYGRYVVFTSLVICLGIGAIYIPWALQQDDFMTESGWPNLREYFLILIPPVGVLGALMLLLNRFPHHGYDEVEYRQNYSHDPSRCGKCGYNLTGNASGVCPECGWKLTRSFFDPRRNRSDGE